jgi:redox-sensitive bicupin YhaK (pirin superfamily)
MIQQVLHRDDLKLGGFAGIRERRLVVDPKVFGNDTSGAWPGIGNFAYLADAKFIPNGETHLHPHKEIDVISVMVEGRIAHEGTLQEGNIIESNQVQVQRAGGEGFAHNEINLDDKENRMIQMWVTPEKTGESADYKSYSLKQGKITRVYGGDNDQDETFSSCTVVDVGLLDANQTVSLDGEFLAYVTVGNGMLNKEAVSNGDLIRGNDMQFQARENSQIIVVRKI